MPYVSDMVAKGTRITLQRVGVRAMILAVVVAALVAAAFTLRGFNEVSAQSDSECEVADLGTLDSNSDSRLETAGRWTTEDCESKFRAGSDAHTFRFEVVEAGRIRIDLKSDEGDSHLYLMSEDGRRITDNDDGGAGLDARLERDLAPGVYLVEATTVGGRGRGEADFTLAVSYVEGCETIHLGTLGPDANLTEEGSWSLETCGSTFVAAHPAYRYSFVLPEDGRVRIDLESEHGDPVLSLASATGIIGANDDGGDGLNSRIEQYMQAGAYMIEATTYLERDLQPLFADFTITVELVDEAARLETFQLKVEETHAPDIVYTGAPFDVHYRVGNLGLGDLADIGGNGWMYVVAPSFYQSGNSVEAAEGFWKPGDSYHSGPEVASEASTSISEVKPFEVTLNRTGPSWVFVAIVTYDEEENEVGFNGLWRNLVVLSGYEFDPMKVRVDGLEYEVSAVADAEGEVTTTVTSVITPEAEVAEELREKALYAAGVQTQMLEGIFERPAVGSLPTMGESEATSAPSPSSRDLMKLFGNQYSAALKSAGMRMPLLDGQSVNPVEVEELLLGMAETASARAVSLVATWKGLQSRVGDASPISFSDAFGLHSQLAYGEKVIAPMVDAGEIVEAARGAEMGWEDEGVQKMMEEYEDMYSCRGPASIAVPLRRAEVQDLGWMLTADTEMRVALPMYEMAVNAVLCADGADEENEQFFANLLIGESRAFLELFDIAPPPPPERPAPYRLRVLSRLVEDGRIEHGVELSNGEQIFPEMRHLAADAEVDEWVESSDVVVGDEVIGQIRSRRLEDGRVEVGYITVTGREVSPRVRYLPDDMPEDVWFRTGNVTATRRAPE